METTQLELIDETHNPLDTVEDVLVSHNWDFNRMGDDELLVNVVGKSGQYKLFFIWQEDMQALQFCAQLDLNIRENNMDVSRKALTHINESLWMGHFDLPECNPKPSYRYTCLLRGRSHENANSMMEDLVDIALAQCEKHFPLFTLLSSANDINDDALSLALMDTEGES